VLASRTDELLPHQRAALTLADALMTQPSGLTVQQVAELRRHFSDSQLVELTLDIMKWNAQKAPVSLGTDVWLDPNQLTDLVFDDRGNWVR
jgi:alkylhydroperoxidase family enzyme